MKQKLLFKAGETVYFAGQKGPAYRVTKGNIRLDHTDEEGEISFAKAISQSSLGSCHTSISVSTRAWALN